jgi:zinc-finger of a C2HC-type
MLLRPLMAFFEKQAFNEYNEVALVRCKNCNRTFNPESLVVHKRKCTAENPFMPLNKMLELEEQKHQ